MIRGYPCRCKKCGSRRTLSRLPHMYKIEKFGRCMRSGCGGDMRVDWFRKNKEHKNHCTCWGYSFPHRKGGGVWCEEHPAGPSDKDYALRYGDNAI